MAFDGIFMAALCNELNENLAGGRIEKIYQPESDALVFSIQNKKKRFSFFVSVNAHLPYFSTIETKLDNPLSPPMFCMLLRKHLSGGQILSLKQEALERVVYIDVLSKDEMGHTQKRCLVIEMMGKHSNVILIDPETNEIFDSLKRIPLSVSRVRQVLPGLTYKLIPTDKFNLKETTKKDVTLSIQNTTKSIPLFKWIYTRYMGISPIRAQSLCIDAQLPSDKDVKSLSEIEIEQLWKAMECLQTRIFEKTYKPEIILEKESRLYKDFSAFPLLAYHNAPSAFSVNPVEKITEAVSLYYGNKERQQRIQSKAQNLKRFLNQRHNRSLRKCQKLKDEQLQAENAEIFKTYGELILANIYTMEKGQEKVTLKNFYDPTAPSISLTLDKRLTPSQNAQRYFKRYAKQKTAQSVLKKQIEDTQQEILYLEQVQTALEQSTEPENIEEIRSELIASGFLKRKNTKKKGHKQKKKSTYFHYISTDGFSILVGKNNLQNDELTLKTASKKDIWLHTKIIPGSHVIIQTKGQMPPESTLFEAATLAAWHSKARQSSQVPVDYTMVKNVSKPKGAKPGMVIYSTNQTLYVTPNEDLVKKLNSHN